MIQLKSVEQARASPIADGVKELVLARVLEYVQELQRMGYAWDPESDGWFVVLEPGEEVGPLTGLGWEQQLSDLLFEFVDHDEAAQCFAAVYIPGNNWGVTIFVPDLPGLDPSIRGWLLEQARDAGTMSTGQGAPP